MDEASTTSDTEGSSSGTTSDAGVCGDKDVDVEEECDLGDQNGADIYGGCNEDCTLQPGCGDGVHQPELGEECDPTDPEFAEAAVCSDACTWDGVIVFVSSASYMGDLGGLDGADEFCQELADSAGLIMPDLYRAWLSVGEQNAAGRVPLGDDPYYRLDGKKVANNASELLGGKLLRAINITENKKVEGVLRVWTNTTSAGLTRSEADDCQSFSSPGDSDVGFFGMTNKTGADWTVSKLPTYCSEESRLYCFSAAF